MNMSYALVTGASKGIGKSIAKNLAKRNYNLILVARSEELLNSTAQEIKAEYTHIDVQYVALDLSDRNADLKLFNWVVQ
ncbi:SDR family NAD(P)-dependent oxidoreductase, partial [Pseudoxanthomonas sp. SGD-10]